MEARRYQFQLTIATKMIEKSHAILNSPTASILTDHRRVPLYNITLVVSSQRLGRWRLHPADSYACTDAQAGENGTRENHAAGGGKETENLVGREY